MYAIMKVKGPPSDMSIPVLVVGAFGYLALSVLVVGGLIPPSHGSWHVDLFNAFVKWGISLMLLFPLFLLTERRLKLLSLIYTTFRSVVIRKI
jgi:hypothetical protein